MTTCDHKTSIKLSTDTCQSLPFYTFGGELNCVYHVHSGNDHYLTLLNLDDTVDNNSTFLFTCIAYHTESDITWGIVESPMGCHAGQMTEETNGHYNVTRVALAVESSKWITIIIAVIVAIICVICMFMIFWYLCGGKRNCLHGQVKVSTRLSSAVDDLEKDEKQMSGWTSDDVAGGEHHKKWMFEDLFSVQKDGQCGRMEQDGGCVPKTKRHEENNDKVDRERKTKDGTFTGLENVTGMENVADEENVTDVENVQKGGNATCKDGVINENIIPGVDAVTGTYNVSVGGDSPKRSGNLRNSAEDENRMECGGNDRISYINVTDGSPIQHSGFDSSHLSQDELCVQESGDTDLEDLRIRTLASRKPLHLLNNVFGKALSRRDTRKSNNRTVVTSLSGQNFPKCQERGRSKTTVMIENGCDPQDLPFYTEYHQYTASRAKLMKEGFWEKRVEMKNSPHFVSDVEFSQLKSEVNRRVRMSCLPPLINVLPTEDGENDASLQISGKYRQKAGSFPSRAPNPPPQLVAALPVGLSKLPVYEYT
ncbi:hypothetical protein Btru_075194 [Bulinus truncatus]|nr:hypothetical protein Btru_075194 [Bulinus truncatus]